MERLKSMKEALVNCAQSNMSNLATVNAEELGEVVDMIKDLEEAIYYHTITESMKRNGSEEESYYTERRSAPVYNYYSDYTYGGRSGSMGYSDGNRQTPGESRNYMEHDFPMMMRDYREGRSGSSRKSYMESKEQHKDTMTKVKELEHYMNELTQDISEMIQDATPEEKQMLQKKISTLATKINV